MLTTRQDPEYAAAIGSKATAISMCRLERLRCTNASCATPKRSRDMPSDQPSARSGTVVGARSAGSAMKLGEGGMTGDVRSGTVEIGGLVIATAIATATAGEIEPLGTIEINKIYKNIS